MEGTPTWEERQLAARIVARYGKGKDEPRVEVEWREDGVVEVLEVEPERDEARIESLRDLAMPSRAVSRGRRLAPSLTRL